jgi:hypothetical protein
MRAALKEIQKCQKLIGKSLSLSIKLIGLDEQADRIVAKKDGNPVERLTLLQISIGALNDSARKFVELAERQIEQAEGAPKSTSSSIVSQCKPTVCRFGQVCEQKSIPSHNLG